MARCGVLCCVVLCCGKVSHTQLRDPTKQRESVQHLFQSLFANGEGDHSLLHSCRRSTGTEHVIVGEMGGLTWTLAPESFSQQIHSLKKRAQGCVLVSTKSTFSCFTHSVGIPQGDQIQQLLVPTAQSTLRRGQAQQQRG